MVKKLIRTSSCSLGLALAMLLAACSSSDDAISDNGLSADSTSTITNNVYNMGGYFIATKTDDGTEWVLQTDSLYGNLEQTRNYMELPQTEYTWVFNGNTAIGMVYQQQFAGLGYGLRYTSENNP